jgi:RNA polymerase sigma-B factor
MSRPITARPSRHAGRRGSTARSVRTAPRPPLPLREGATPVREDASALLQRYHDAREPADRDALVERFLPLARHLASRYSAGADRDDLDQVAAIGLIKSIDRFDPSRGIAFSSFAVPTILGELKRHFRDLGWSVRVPRSLQELANRVAGAVEELSSELGRTPTTQEIAGRCGVSVEQVLEARATVTAHRPISLDQPSREDDDEPGPQLIGHEDGGYAEVERAADLDRLLSRLPEREQLVLRMRFHEDLVQRDIAERMGISQMQVSRLITHAIDTLAE